MRFGLGRAWRALRRARGDEAFLAGILTSLLAVGVGGFLFAESGLFEVAASKPHGPFMSWLLHTTMEHSVKLRARKDVAPARFDREGIVAGFCAYQAHCVACHGALSVGRPRWVTGLTPNPPYLIDAPRRWSPSELHWIIGHGVKMTAMPAWQDTLSDRDIWNIVAWLETANRKPGAYVAMRAANLCPPAAPPPGAAPLPGAATDVSG